MGDDHIDEPALRDNEKKSSATTRRKVKEVKSQRKAALRKRALGVGIGKIDIDASGSTKGTKISFDDDFVAKDSDDDENDNIDEAKETTSDDDSDGAVEMVSSSAAKQESMELRAAERTIRREERMATQKRKRKKAKEVVSDDKDSSGDELDDDFLDMVDFEREKDAKEKKMKISVEEPRVGRHTTFDAEDDGPNSVGTMIMPIATSHNIDVVVLPGDEENADGEDVHKVISNRCSLASSSRLGTKQSETASNLGKTNVFHMRGNMEANENDLKRSRKMNFKLRSGKAARNFLVNKGVQQDNY